MTDEEFRAISKCDPWTTKQQLESMSPFDRWLHVWEMIGREVACAAVVRMPNPVYEPKFARMTMRSRRRQFAAFDMALAAGDMPWPR